MASELNTHSFYLTGYIKTIKHSESKTFSDCA